MILAIDIGNTATSLGFYEDSAMLHRVKVSTILSRTSDECRLLLEAICQSKKIPQEKISGSVMSSVVPQTTKMWVGAITDFIGRKPLLLSHGVKTGLDIRVDIHTEVGSDIVADMVGASKYLSPPYIVIDLGTATTVSVAGKTGELIGVIIIPGVGISLDALSSAASALPKVNVAVPSSILGKNTEESMMSGALYGSAAMIDSIIDRIKEELGTDVINLISCGGFAKTIIPHCKHKIQIKEELTTDGLIQIFHMNERKNRHK